MKKLANSVAYTFLGPWFYSFPDDISQGRIPAVRAYLEKNKGAANEFCIESRRLPLGIALSSGHIEMIRLLLDFGADPVKASQDSASHGSWLYRCVWPSWVPSIEVMLLHPDHAANVYDYFRTHKPPRGTDKRAAAWVRELSTELQSFHSSNDARRLEILDHRIEINKQRLGTLRAETDVEWRLRPYVDLLALLNKERELYLPERVAYLSAAPNFFGYDSSAEEREGLLGGTLRHRRLGVVKVDS